MVPRPMGRWWLSSGNGESEMCNTAVLGLV
jgi:hypothetical protein